MNHIILIGYRCSGKTSAGRRLAEKWKRPFYDSDAMIINRTGKTIQEWVGEKGWESFRQAEKAIIKEIPSWDRGVIALGGGATIDPGIRELIKKNGLIVCLTADVQTIIERMKADPLNKDLRPPLSTGDLEAEVRATLSERLPSYALTADFIVDTKGKSLEEVTREICTLIGYDEQTV